MLHALHFAKLLSVIALFAGAIGAVVAGSEVDRRRFALWLAAPGLGLAWTLGFLLAQLTDVSLLSSWVLGALALSFLSLQGVLFRAARPSSGGPVLGAVILLPLIATVALMVWRPD